MRGKETRCKVNGLCRTEIGIQHPQKAKGLVVTEPLC